MALAGEILVLAFSDLGHLFPSIELCKRISSRNFQTTLIVSSAVSSTIPSTVLQRHPLFRIAEIPPPPPPTEGPPPFDPFGYQMGPGIESMLSGRPDRSPRPVCVVIDVMMSWSKEIFAKFGIPIVAFITSNACFPAMEYATWRAHVNELKPGETRHLPGLPDEMAVSYFDLQRRPHAPHGGPGAPGFGPQGGQPAGKHFRRLLGPGSEPMWLGEVEGTIGLLVNTLHDLEAPFMDYVGQQAGKPVWGVGPLLPEEYWNPAGSVIHDRDIRPKRQSSHSEEEVIQWLDAKPKGSVLYISFGSRTGPSAKENAELASALEESDKAFIWVVTARSRGPGQPFYPHGLEAKVGERGLILREWAPQLLILGHPSTGGFLTHCGWNSTTEAIGRGVPMLAWPIGGDQFFTTKLVVSHLKLGHKIKEDMSEMVEKDDIVKGIEKLMCDRGAKMRAEAIRDKFQGGFPAASEAALDAFKDFLA